MQSRNLILLTTLLLGVLSCKPAPQRTELISQYTSNPQAFEKLKQMILQDASKDEYFAVGYDNIAYYWKEDDKWRNSRSGNHALLSLSDTLKTVGISENRYAEYINLFKKTGSERVTLYQGNHTGKVVDVLLYRSGNVTSGTSASIAWTEKPPKNLMLYGKNNYCGITLLRNGWYLDVFCD